MRINARFKVEVFDEFVGTVHARAADGVDVFADIREAVRVVYEDADRFGLFEDRELRRVYGEAFEREAIAAMGERVGRRASTGSTPRSAGATPTAPRPSWPGSAS